MRTELFWVITQCEYW